METWVVQLECVVLVFTIRRTQATSRTDRQTVALMIRFPVNSYQWVLCSEHLSYSCSKLENVECMQYVLRIRCRRIGILSPYSVVSTFLILTAHKVVSIHGAHVRINLDITQMGWITYIYGVYSVGDEGTRNIYMHNMWYRTTHYYKQLQQH